MPDDTKTLIDRLVGGDPSTPAQILDRAASTDSAQLLVAAALVAAQAGVLLDRAASCATSTRERQLVAVAAAQLAGDGDRFDVLVRDHLADHPDDVLAAWIATRNP